MFGDYLGCTTSIYQKENGNMACLFNLEESLTKNDSEKKCASINGRLPEIKSSIELKDVLYRVVRIKFYNFF